VMWTLFTRDEQARPLRPDTRQFGSKLAALEAALVAKKSGYVTVLYINEPDGNRIDSAKIEVWCKAAR
jgi:hypothetical protein